MLSTIKRIALCATAVAALALAFSAGARAQDVFFAVGYYSNANTTGAPDGTLRLVNDGFRDDSSPLGDLCAAIYVFDDREEMQECCSCKVTPNGYLALGVNANLTANTLTGRKLTRGVIKVVSSQPLTQTKNGVCDPTSATSDANNHIGIRGWLTHIVKVGTGFQVSVEDLKDSHLQTGNPPPAGTEAADLAEDCQVAIELGSGQGTCTCGDVNR
jgi:hypothetical protein